jgi:integrase
VAEQGTHKPLVGGSNPPATTKVLVRDDNSGQEILPLREILILLLGSEGKRVLSLRTKTNPELFELYRAELGLRYRSQRALKESYRILAHFQQYLANYPPSAEIAKAFLGQFTNRKTTTLARYTQIIGGFMKWYGEPLNLKIRLPKVLPQNVDSSNVAKIEAAMRNRKTHKKIIERDILLIETARLTGLRRTELASLRVGDIDFINMLLVVRSGKGEKDRPIPLVQSLCTKLQAFCRGKEIQDQVFGLAPASISNKISVWASKAGCPEIHTHSLRHEFGTNLARNKVNARTIQNLLGHANLATSQRYVDVMADDLRDAVNSLEKLEANQQDESTAEITPPKATRNFPIVPETPDNSKMNTTQACTDATPDNLEEAIKRSDSTVEDILDSHPKRAKNETAAQLICRETAHRAQMRELAGTMAEGIRFPSPWDKGLLRDLPIEFRPGKYYLPIGTVEIKENGKVKVKYPNPGAGIAARHLVDGLFDHLGTSGSPKFAELVGDQSKFSDLTEKFEKYATALINLLKLITAEVKELNTNVNFNDEIVPGLTRWFIITIWEDVISNAGGNSWISDSWYKAPKSIPGISLLKLDCGAYTLGMARDEKTLKMFENWHKKLRNKFAKHKSAKEIHAKDQGIIELAQQIRERLQRFSDVEYLPGTCDLCRQ